MPPLLGIDLGTSGLKAAVFDLDGSLLGQGRALNQYVTGPTGWAEQDPRSWWAACGKAVQMALARSSVRAADVAAVGVCGFHHCPVFLDADGDPVRPTIVTHDSRLGQSLADLKASGLYDEIVEISGSRVMTGHFPPIYHLVLGQEPDTVAKTRWILLSKDYLRFKLTGNVGTEICDATGTNLIAMPEQDWSDALCGLLQVPREMLPRIGGSSQLAGQVTEEAAQVTGLAAGTPVVYGGGDSHCALVGLGVIGTGEAGLLLGSNSTLRASFGGFVRHFEHAVWTQQHVVRNRYTTSASSMAGASALAWFKGVCDGNGDGEPNAYHELEALAASVPPGSEGLFFHPYLYGERSPFYNPQARGAFLSIAHWHGKGHLARSVMEGVAFSIANCFDAVQAVADKRDEQVRRIRTGTGGGNRLPVWRQIISDVLGLALELVPVDEAGCLGAALLAGVGVGLYEDIENAVRRTVRVASETIPDPENRTLYRERRAVFNDSYRALEPILYSNNQSTEVE
jgi:xylulokinase